MALARRFCHSASQSVVGMLLLCTASSIAMGTTSHGLQTTSAFESAGNPVTSPFSREVRTSPSCTPGFSCKGERSSSRRVSRIEAVQFALLIGAGTSR